MKIVGVIHSPFKEKFAIPRQANLVNVPMQIEIYHPYNKDEAFKGLENFSHIIILFLFHEISEDEEKLSVRPPRLGGNVTQGVFATRSPFRPNRIGFSVVELKNFTKDHIEIIGGDFLDQTPIIDIKPYLSYSDAIPHAKSNWTNELVDQRLNVTFECENHFIKSDQLTIITEILAQNPRPRFHEDNKKTYAVKLYEYDLHFRIQNENLTVFKIIFI